MPEDIDLLHTDISKLSEHTMLLACIQRDKTTLAEVEAGKRLDDPDFILDRLRGYIEDYKKLFPDEG